MVEAITRKLNRFEKLDADDAAALVEIAHRGQSYSPHADIVKVGSKPEFALAILSGWAIRYIVLKDGSRQITAFLMPGDFCHLNMLSAVPMDHNIAAISPVTVAHIKRDDVERMFIDHPNVAKAVRGSQFADESRLRASITNIGRHSAEQRLGYMLCDLWTRADAVGLIDDDRLHFPPTQADVADCIGLTAVHVNRVMQRLRQDGLVELRERYLRLPDFDRLAGASDYNTTVKGIGKTYHASAINGRVSPVPQSQQLMHSHN